ncbi:MAG: histidine ammonia-lyase [Candidatus Eremiobacteraeota bacterium]|nr:histidine ammonia-lyase [Candidatus Eremiobacteraeota bacterium]MBC5803581.1 histidine ammonia-lyase [Candidatus Eremiobacteraeota bacterium]MBC5822660.1 histidine ammonia-lyase [Candidatus Eremiobacteraeota bacterium]
MLTLRAGMFQLRDARAILRSGVQVTLDGDAREAVDRAAAVVAEIAARDASVYGVNTGFGKLAHKRIPRDKLADLQRNLVVSHACGVGQLLPRDVVRLVLALKVNSLARGYSGIRWSVIQTLLACLERDVLPAIPAQGSVGASGDLAPLAHLSATLIGIGDAIVDGRRCAAAEALASAGIAPVALEAKEGLALLNGTQVSTALALDGLIATEDVLAASLVACALSLEAALGSVTPFDPRIHAVRGHAAQSDVAAALRRLVAGTEINESHRDCGRVQDPYSLRCTPQVLGACLHTIRDCAAVLIDEANAVSDNPLVFADTREVLSGGNFHAEPVGLASDALAVALAEIGNISERRCALLVDPVFSGLPAFLATEPGLESGYMIAQVTAAALASENKGRAFPASVDTIPTSAGQEDHVSMATHAARRLGEMARNAANIVAVELLSAARGIAFRRPLRTSDALEAVLSVIAPDGGGRGDRYLAPEIERVAALVLGGTLTPLVADLFPTMRP